LKLKLIRHRGLSILKKLSGYLEKFSSGAEHANSVRYTKPALRCTIAS
jgi:hypothetical protein